MNMLNYQNKEKPKTAELIAETLRRQGYDICNWMGNPINKPEDTRIGILDPGELVEKKFLWLIPYVTFEGREHLANLYLDSPEREAVLKEQWVLKINDFPHHEDLERIIGTIADIHRVNLKVMQNDEPTPFDYTLIGTLDEYMAGRC